MGRLIAFLAALCCVAAVSAISLRAKDVSGAVSEVESPQAEVADGGDSFLQIGAGAGSIDEHGYCELCIYAVHQVQYGALPSCGGSDKSASFSACSQVVQSMLAYAHDVMHLIAYGCYKYSPYRGWQTVRPCPAHVICGRLVNIYDYEKKAHCPADFHYRFPHALGNNYPQVKNPLLKYALQLYSAGGDLPTLMEKMKTGIDTEPPQPIQAFPNPATAGTLPGTAYAQSTTAQIVTGNPPPRVSEKAPGVTPPPGSAEMYETLFARLSQEVQKAVRAAVGGGGGGQPPTRRSEPEEEDDGRGGMPTPAPPNDGPEDQPGGDDDDDDDDDDEAVKHQEEMQRLRIKGQTTPDTPDTPDTAEETGKQRLREEEAEKGRLQQEEREKQEKRVEEDDKAAKQEAEQAEKLEEAREQQQRASERASEAAEKEEQTKARAAAGDAALDELDGMDFGENEDIIPSSVHDKVAGKSEQLADVTSGRVRDDFQDFSLPDAGLQQTGDSTR